jgi:hypothetical protein
LVQVLRRQGHVDIGTEGSRADAVWKEKLDGHPTVSVGEVMNDAMWERDDVQFPRLISELKAVGLTDAQMEALSQSMGLDRNRIHELLDRGEEVFETIKGQSVAAERDCALCGGNLNGEMDAKGDALDRGL